MEDKLLVEGCLLNDRLVQKELYAKYFKKMFQICLSYSGNREEAKDILQDAFVKVFTNIKNYDNRNSLEGWIRRIVTNTAIDYFRQKKRLVFIEDYKEIEEVDESESNVFEQIHNEVVLNFIKKLPEGARIVFTLFALEGFKHQDIALQLNITEGTSKSQYKRAKSLLKSWLYDYQKAQL
jgi:RNA polymerase sigma factor (sigma-70 family)